jgi:tRNA threonylcarbamoyladenosine biosynthesis protein TsaE
VSKINYKIESLQNIKAIAKDFIHSFGEPRVFAFSGEMGVGKTTFISALLSELGETHQEGSPTYSLVNSYDIPSVGKLYHMDLYRINSELEALDMGIEEILYSNAFCFIEWPEKIENLLPKNTIWVYIRKEQDETRILTVENGN